MWEGGEGREKGKKSRKECLRAYYVIIFI